MDNAVDSTVTIKTSINSLPLEIKTLIVKLAQLQDEKYWERYNSVNQHVHELFANVLAKNEWRGNSLNALFLVNKEWSDLAAVEIFKVLNIHNMNSPVFKFNIVPDRGHLVKGIGFFTTNNSSDALMLLPAFPNLTRIEINSSVIQRLFLSSSHSSPVIDYRLSLHALAKKGISSLQLLMTSVQESITVLQVCHQLTDLDLRLEENEGIEDVKLLGENICKYSLEKFMLSSDGDMPRSWLTLRWNSSTTLNYLALRFARFDISALNFLSIFSKSLNSLAIFFQDYELSNTIKPSMFKKLQYLKLELSTFDTFNILKVFKKSPLVCLQLQFSELEYDLEEQQSIVSITQLVEQISTLREIQISTRFIDHDQFFMLIDHCISNNISLRIEQWHQQIFRHRNFRPSIRDKSNHYEPILKNALVDGQTKLDELIDQDDVEGMEEMFNNCKWLRATSAYMRE